MSQYLDAVRIPLSAKADASGIGVITAPRVAEGQILVCQSIAWKNETGARGTATFRVKSGGVVYPVNDQVSPAANTWYCYPYEVDVLEGEQIEVSQASCTQNDVLDLVITGYIVFRDDLV